jgi:mono/diheme cytochrome c family protein
MSMKRLAQFVIAVSAIAGAPASLAQAARVDHGKIEYEAHCAICHGAQGRGNGEMRKFLTVPPSDLTTLARRNGGAFPNQLVWDTIDGRGAPAVGPHGGREMPVWGQAYRQEALAQAVSAQQPEWYVRNRIVALLDYLSRMQER